ncbi:MAG: Ppx/GppA phosphatase family protein [Nitrolancea sp.]
MNHQVQTVESWVAGPDTEPTGRVAVVDLGSNSGRLVVFDQYGSGYLSIVEDARVPLRLASDLQRDGRLSDEAMVRTIDALHEFHSIARGAGADRIIVVGTASMREASNGDAFLHSIQEAAGLPVEILDGDSEARYSFMGAIHGLPVWNGYVLDIGGGSLEITQFRDRRDVASWTLPLGALRTTTEFIKSDPPASKEIRNLKKYVTRMLMDVGITPAESEDVLVGTGGTIRNLAKIDRKSRRHLIDRLHGYHLPFSRVRRITSVLSSSDLSRRANMSGLNSDRADSIVGGAIAAQAVMEAIGADDLLVSGKGLREGIAFGLADSHVPDPEYVKRTSIAALARRFGSWEAERAEQRIAALTQLISVLEIDAQPEFCAMSVFAACLLDIGRSVDYYDRLSHSATIVQVADLDGFTHREIALLAAIIREADRRQSDLSQYMPLLTDADADSVARFGMVLLIADEIERRYPRNTEIKLKIECEPESVTITIPPFSEYGVAKLGERFHRVFGRELVFN